MDVLHYLGEHGADPFQDWLDGLTDQKARLAVYQRVSRLIAGNLGDHKACQSGVWELRIDVGPGYRVYFARPLRETVLVLNGGDKRRQRRGHPARDRILDRLPAQGKEATTMSTRASRSHEEASIEMFRKDPDFATAYLNHVLMDGNQEDLLLALRYMSEAFGGIASLANSAGLNPKTLYRTLSARGNPELRSLSALLRAMGMTLAVQPLESPASRPRSGVRRP